MKCLSLLILLLISGHVWSAGKLLLIGGGDKPRQAMEKFVAASGKDQLILVIPWASNSLASGPSLAQELRNAQATNIEIINLPLALSTFKEKLNSAQGVFFTGGDQNRLMQVIKRYQLQQPFRKRFAEGAIFAGTSAGTAIMSQQMLTGNESELSEGLGLLPTPYILDQHFLIRNRWQRLADIISKNNLTGIGIDEDNALFIQNNYAEVFGPTEIQVLQIHSGRIETTSYKNGDKIKLLY